MAAGSAVAPTAAARARSDRLERFVGQGLALLLSLLIALGLGSILIIGFGESPAAIYAKIFKGSLGTADGLGYVFSIATPLIFSAQTHPTSKFSFRSGCSMMWT